MVEEVSTDALERALNSDRDVELIDIRKESEFMSCRIPEATNIPMSRLTSEMSTRSWGDEIYIICRHGNSSIKAGMLLESYQGVEEGATVASVEGGYLDWEGELEREQKAAKAVA